MPAIRRATEHDLDALAPLFDAYRAFYTGTPEPDASRAFIAERLRRGDSVVFLASVDGRIAGFIQLYPALSSVAAARVWLLNDLYVDAWARRRGVADALMAAAEAFARDDGAPRMELETDHDNASAQALYEARGWRRYDGICRYRLPLHG